MNLNDFTSHGFGTLLTRHIDEVCLAGSTPYEKLAIACHDIGKAWTIWQDWCNNNFPSSEVKGCIGYYLKKNPTKVSYDNWPEISYRHERVGAIFSFVYFCVKKEYRMADLALSINISHHSHLHKIYSMKEIAVDWLRVHNDPKFLFFTENYLAKFGVTKDEFTKVITFLNAKLTKKGSINENCDMFFQENSFKPYHTYLYFLLDQNKVDILFDTRKALGLLTFQDTYSASLMSQSLVLPNHYDVEFPNKSFVRRTKTLEPKSVSAIDHLRNSLLENTLKMVESDSLFYILSAATGLGKTHSFICLAEALIEKYNLDGMVIAAPTIAINSQTYNTLKNELGADNIQIWNYANREASVKSESTSEFIRDRHVEDPFSHSYSLTTFNQVMSAVCDNHRDSCVKSLSLKNKVIIIDEFHKFNISLLPYVFRMLGEFARRNNCRIIMASATPIDIKPLVESTHTICTLGDDFVNCMFHDVLVNNRRQYKFIGDITTDGLTEEVLDAHKTNESLLVVCNLVAKGTRDLIEALGCNEINPWNVLRKLESTSDERVIIIMDGLTPKCVRELLINGIKTRLQNNKPVTLISTAMVEVGVDLDFDMAIVDWMGLNSVVQRGGRVNRNGSKGRTCSVKVFRHLADYENKGYKPSWEVLYVNNIGDKRSQHIDHYLKNLQARSIKCQEDIFDELSKHGNWLSDCDINDESDRVARRQKYNLAYRDVWKKLLGENDDAIKYQNCAYIAEIYDNEEYGVEYVLFESKQEAECFEAMAVNGGSYKNLVSFKDKSEFKKNVKAIEAQHVINNSDEKRIKPAILRNFNLTIIESEDNVLGKPLIICYPK